MILEAKGISKIYKDSSIPVEVLDHIDFKISKGDVVGISGRSGSGKSTFLHIIGGLDRPSRGEIIIDGQSLYSFKGDILARFRNTAIGFVFQFYHLLKEFSVLENVMLPCLIAGLNRKDAKKRAYHSLEEVGLENRAMHLPSTISGGEQQRAAIARAAVMMPNFIFADEPTGNLDEQSGKMVMDYLLKLNKDMGVGVVIVSHNTELLNSLPKNYVLREKKLWEGK